MMKDNQTQTKPAKLTVDFSHRFANAGDSEFQNQIDTLIHMSDRALNVLELITPEIQGAVQKHVSGALFNVIAEVEDIKAFAYAMQMQGDTDGK
jgi:predicted HD phosphohydrolase